MKFWTCSYLQAMMTESVKWLALVCKGHSHFWLHHLFQNGSTGHWDLFTFCVFLLFSMWCLMHVAGMKCMIQVLHMNGWKLG